MKTTILTILLLFGGAAVAMAQIERYVTITANTNATSQYAITSAEAAQLVYFAPTTAGVPTMSYQKDGLSFPTGPNPSATTGLGATVKGPATFTITAQSSAPASMTLKLIPESFDPNKTLILPPGTNQVYVSLESSTNLVNWADATNGVYGSPDTARFFRIRMAKL